jgi:hypothetical protein
MRHLLKPFGSLAEQNFDKWLWKLDADHGMPQTKGGQRKSSV